MNFLLEFNNISKKYKDQTVIKDFNFRLMKGEVVVFLGPSGCGKTTILNMAAGITKQTAGDIQIYTKDIGYVFQEPRLMPWKTVLDNILFVMEKKENMKRKAMHALSKVGLEEASQHYPRQLSGGMKQRVSIARAIVSNPKIILMDEPFSALDESLKRELQEDVIAIIEENGVGVIYVTHDVEEALRVADRIIVLEDRLCKVKKEVTIERDRRKRDMAYIQKSKAQLNDYLIGRKNYAETL